MEKENWPIRVGGEYQGNDPDVRKRVTALDGNRVFYTLVWNRGKDHAFGSYRTSVEIFRTMANPEDQSPLPAVEKFLETYIAWMYDAEQVRKNLPMREETEMVTTARELLARIKGEA